MDTNHELDARQRAALRDALARVGAATDRAADALASGGGRVGDAAARLASLSQRLAEVGMTLDQFGAGISSDAGAGADRPGRLTRAEARERTRERLLAAAADVFNRVGYHAASLEAVADAAGYTKGAVYSNFSSKHDLLLALIRRESRLRLEPMLAALDILPIEAFIELSGSYLQAQTAKDEGFDVLTVEFWLVAMRDPEVRRAVREVERTEWEQLGALIEGKLAAAGLASPFDGEEIARLMSALGTGLMFQLYMDPDHWDVALFGRTLRLIVGLPSSDPGGIEDGPATPAVGSPSSDVG